MGKVVKKVTGLHVSSEEVVVHFTDGTVFYMFHCVDCCEDVSIIDIEGGEDSLIGAEWRGVKESTKDDPEQEDGCGMWTFYTILTSKGHVWIRWYGSSHSSYYAIGVSTGYADDVSKIDRL